MKITALALTFATACTGIDAASCAWAPLGWRCAWASEIDPFCCSVLRVRVPGVPNLGDMTGITAQEARAHGPVDVFMAGTPCQSFSVAGLRGGLADPRGVLMLDALRLTDAMGALWLVWENVPGVLSSNGGRDFGAFLGALGELGYGWAYRVLDAEYFGLAQRRERVFVVARAGGRWDLAAAVLFERSCLRGDPAPRPEAGAEVAACIGGSPAGSGWRNDFERSGAFVPVVSPALKARDSKGPSSDGDGDGAPLVPVYQCHGGNVGPLGALRSGSGNVTSGVPFTLVFDTAQIACPHNRANPRVGGPAPTISAQSSMHVAQTITATNGKNPQTAGNNPGLVNPIIDADGARVRRLTPREFERLQGFPDDWTLVPHRGKPAADGPRYRAVGNSIAVPVLRWIGERIAMVETLERERLAT